ncbi:winged helix-turn-helix domain-containing protein [Candidatus Woesearchaeota archaeon]|nr:winged helix-turn-helix domain-containing protein [Candidatus Woesearchaeota archaeon]
MEEKIIALLRDSDKGGQSITSLVGLSGISRSRVRTALAKLEGAGQIEFRKVGMAKLYTLKGGT